MLRISKVFSPYHSKICRLFSSIKELQVDGDPVQIEHDDTQQLADGADEGEGMM